jgi:alkylated DNA nucleotide flippase Atl1
MSTYVSSDAEAVYDAARSVPAGKVITYADLAQLVGRPTSHARNVATLLGNRPDSEAWLTDSADAHDIPWWRVVRSDGTLLDTDQIRGPRAQWVDWALDRLAEEGVPLVGEGARRCVDMREATRLPIPDGIAPWKPAPKASRVTLRREAEPCWRHDTVQYSCRECAPAR